MDRHVQHAAFARHFREWAGDDPEGFQHAAKQVRELTEQPGWEVMRGLLKTREDGLLSVLTHTPSGLPQIPSHEQYAAVTGEIRGIQRVLGLAHTMLVVADEEDRKLAEFAGATEEG